MQRGADRPLEREPGAADEDAERREQRPKEALPPVSERMALISRASAAEHTDEKEGHDRHVSRIGSGLGSERDGAGHPCCCPERNRLGAIHGE